MNGLVRLAQAPALREAEGRLRIAGAAANVGAWRLDLQTQLDTRDANLNRLLALEAVDSTQPIDDFLDRLHPDDSAIVQAQIEEAVRERGPYKSRAKRWAYLGGI